EIIFTVVTTLLLYRVFLIMNRHLEEIEKRGDSTIV
ncbi:MAG: rod shape-determining protein MreD, partial [Paenibacillaceae bacterium]|nr:rod shape-determining protein MreD [Paenibacillaceae bacterium]